MDLFEELVMNYLTKFDDFIFIHHQYPIKVGSHSNNWIWPDFVVLNFKKKRVGVVEVSTAFNIDNLVKKVNDRDKNYITKIKEQLKLYNVINDSWEDFTVEVFIRADRKRDFLKKLNDRNGVNVTELEEVVSPWKYNALFKKTDKDS